LRSEVATEKAKHEQYVSGPKVRFVKSSNPFPRLFSYITRGPFALMMADTTAVPSDTGLVSAIASGDESAMGQLYDRYSAVVYSIALRVLGDAGMAEDLLQEIFMQLWRNPMAFDSSRGALAPWLVAVTRNRAIDWLRKRRPETPVADVALSFEPDLASKTEFARSVGKIRAMLDRMPPTQRDVLEMAYFEGLTHSEIAARTGQPLGTVKTRIRSGLLTLRTALTP